jgi:hypothetical protein
MVKDATGRITRPRQIYTGELRRKFVPVYERQLSGRIDGERGCAVLCCEAGWLWVWLAVRLVLWTGHALLRRLWLLPAWTLAACCCLAWSGSRPPQACNCKQQHDKGTRTGSGRSCPMN